MNILIELSLILCAVRLFSFFNWSRKNDKNNITGNISIFLLGIILLLTLFLVYKDVN